MGRMRTFLVFINALFYDNRFLHNHQAGYLEENERSSTSLSLILLCLEEICDWPLNINNSRYVLKHSNPVYFITFLRIYIYFSFDFVFYYIFIFFQYNFLFIYLFYFFYYLFMLQHIFWKTKGEKYIKFFRYYQPKI